MEHVLGTQGYESAVQKFLEVSRALPFDEVNAAYLDFLPGDPCRVLDVGAGAGQNAAALAKLGHTVTAVEPLAPFLEAARRAYADLNVVWKDDCLPRLQSLEENNGQFDFILVQAVWHHLNEEERRVAMRRLADLLDKGGVCALSLRNGPAGMGTHVFPTDGTQTISDAEQCGLKTKRHLADQPSYIKGKKDVVWSHLVFEKPKRFKP